MAGAPNRDPYLDGRRNCRGCFGESLMCSCKTCARIDKTIANYRSLIARSVSAEMSDAAKYMIARLEVEKASVHRV